jgi:ubiquinone/menaquinone biosynthesis C-methylase UbiE
MGHEDEGFPYVDGFSEAEAQVLIALVELTQAGEGVDPERLAGFEDYFGKYRVDWTDALVDLVENGLVARQGRDYALTARGRERAEGLCRERPKIWYWYNAYYEATLTSRAYSTFCERVFGRDFSQHGFSDMAQLDKLLEVTALGPENRALDVGCGNGAMAEYISDVTGAHVTGIDYIPEAIRQARERTQSKRRRLAFEVGDIGRLDLPPRSFDTLISIDTLYFTDLDETIGQMKGVLAPGGQMGIFYSHRLSTPTETFSRDTLPPDRTPLARALQAHGLGYQVWDFTAEDYVHARLKKRVVEELRADLEAEGNLFLYKSRHGEAVGVMKAIEANAHARYLYHVTA